MSLILTVKIKSLIESVLLVLALLWLLSLQLIQRCVISVTVSGYEPALQRCLALSCSTDGAHLLCIQIDISPSYLPKGI